MPARRRRVVLHQGLAELRLGDSLSVLRELDSASVDAVVTDPPYSSGGTFPGQRQRDPQEKYVQSGQKHVAPSFAGDTRDQRAHRYWCALWLSQCLRVAKPGSPIVVFTDWRQLPTTVDALQAGGWTWRGIVPWNKTEGCRPRLGGFRTQCEYAVWGSKGAFPDRPHIGALPGLVTAYPKDPDKRHIAGKPLAVMRALVSVCDPGGVVLDPFLGSGTTGVAALEERRRFVGVEIEPHWFDVGRERIAQARTPRDAEAEP